MQTCRREHGNMFAEERLVLQAQKLKRARETVSEKLEEYRQQYEEMQVRAVNAETQITMLELQNGEMVSKYEEKIKLLNEQLNAQKKALSKSETSLQQFHRKLNRIRDALSKEVNKLRHSEKDLRLALESVMRCVLEFRTNAITEEDFLCAVDLIFSTIKQHDHTSSHSHTHIDTLFGSPERQHLASLSREQRKSRLAQLMNMLTEKSLNASTDEDLLSMDECATPSPPPVPPRRSTRTQLFPNQPLSKKSVASRRKEAASKTKDPHQTPPVPAPKPAKSAQKRNVTCGTGIYSLATNPESDSDSDFEHFTPPVRSRKRYCSEPSKFGVSPHSSLRRSSSPYPVSIPDGEHKPYLENASAVLTRRPSWLKAKQPSMSKGRSRSLDAVTQMKVASFVSVDSEDTTGDSGGYAKPFAHLQSWRKVLGLKDSSILTGSHPCINKAMIDSDMTYLDPSEIAATVHRTGSKLGRRVSQRLLRRVDTILTSAGSDYLTLVSTLKKTDADLELGAIHHPITPYIMMNTAAAEVEKWKTGVFNFPEHLEGGQSGYASDTSSVDFEKVDSLSRYNGYAEIPEGPFPRGIDNILYDSNSQPTPVADETYASIKDVSLSQRTQSQSPLPSQGRTTFSADSQSHADPAMDLHDGYCYLQEEGANANGLSNSSVIPHLPTCTIESPPTPPPRRPVPPPRPHWRKLSSDALNDRDSMLKPPQITAPLYTTLRGRHHHVHLVPLALHSPEASSDEYGLSDGEHPSHLYSLGKFVRSPPSSGKGTLVDKRSLVASPPTNGNPLASSEFQRPEKSNGHPPASPQRSHTFHAGNLGRTVSSPIPQPLAEKSGYLDKMEPRQKPSRKWFVLKDTTLKYFRSKESMFGLHRPRDTISLDSWCKLTRHDSKNSFELATPRRTFHLAAANRQEYQEWLSALQAAMQTPMEVPPLKSKRMTVTGWAQVSKRDGHSRKVWCSLEGNSLNLSAKPGDQPMRRIGMRRTTIKKIRDSLLMDAKDSTSNLQSMLISISEEGEGVEGEVTYIVPEDQREKDSWYYHLSAASAGGEGPELTHTEKLLRQIIQEGGKADHQLWKHPILKCTRDPLNSPLTSLPSHTLNQTAKSLFQSIQLFMNTPIDPMGLDYHMVTVQRLLSTCLHHPLLQNELYCQILRQISGHTIPTSSTVLQGWYLLHLVIPIFLPSQKFLWYLNTFLDHHTSSPHPSIAKYARQCQMGVQWAEGSGPREYCPSRFELQALMASCAHLPAAFQSSLRIPVYLMDGTSQEMEFGPSTSVQEFVSQLNQKIGMPDTTHTGFALMSDWPGMEDSACFYPPQESKLCDLISMWTDTMEELNQLHRHQHRDIMLEYRNRLSFQAHRGHETDKEAMLLANQTSKEVVSDRHRVSMEESIRMAALMAQTEYGDWSVVGGGSDSEVVAREALQRFCPRKFIQLALEHDRHLLQQKLVGQWRELKGMTPQQCAHRYLTMAQEWRFYGATLFAAEEYFSSQKTRAIWLAVCEDGVSLLDRNTLGCLKSYSYTEVSTFGGHGNDLMLVVSPQQEGRKGSKHVDTEKLLLSMPKIEIREATLLIANYLEHHPQDTSPTLP